MHVDSGKPQEQVIIKVRNSLGQPLQEYEASNTSQMSFALPEETGVYWVEVIVDDKAPVVKKVIKQ